LRVVKITVNLITRTASVFTKRYVFRQATDQLVVAESIYNRDLLRVCYLHKTDNVVKLEKVCILTRPEATVYLSQISTA